MKKERAVIEDIHKIMQVFLVCVLVASFFFCVASFMRCGIIFCTCSLLRSVSSYLFYYEVKTLYNLSLSVWSEHFDTMLNDFSVSTNGFR